MAEADYIRCDACDRKVIYFWHGSTRKPHQFKLGDNGGCFEAALRAVRTWGGVLEHPCNSHAWKYFGLMPPKRHKGWQPAGDGIGHTCYVEQGHYGHMSRKPTWLYAAHVTLPELNWTKGAQRLHPVALERYGDGNWTARDNWKDDQYPVVICAECAKAMGDDLVKLLRLQKTKAS